MSCTQQGARAVSLVLSGIKSAYLWLGIAEQALRSACSYLLLSEGCCSPLEVGGEVWNSGLGWSSLSAGGGGHPGPRIRSVQGGESLTLAWLATPQLPGLGVSHFTELALLCCVLSRAKATAGDQCSQAG